MMNCRALLSGGILLLLLLPFFCDSSWGSPLSLEKYRSSIREALSRVESEKGPLKPEEAAFLEDHFPPHLDVNTKSGEPVPVDNGSLLRLVKEGQESEQGREALIAHLKALGNQISFVDKPTPLSEDRWAESRASLEKVFSAKEFQDLEEAKVPAWISFLNELWRKAWEWLLRHGSAIQRAAGWMEYVFYGVILSAVLLLALWIVRRFGPVSRRVRDVRIKSGQERKASGMDWRALRDESHHQGEKGEYRGAIRLFFISVLMEGHERGWWVYRREATNREHLSVVEASAERRDALGKMVQVYENVWYGHESPGKETLLQCEEWLRLIEVG